MTAAAPKPVLSSWIRPGVVVHGPDEPIDGLLAEFALTLKGRGFTVAGYVQRNNAGSAGSGGGCADRIEYFDLATSATLSAERGAAVGYLHRAMRDDTDLLVISRFSACIGATESVQVPVGPDDGQGMPILTSIAGCCLHKWHSYMRHPGAMLSPDLQSLWSWWGPERLYRDLALGVADDEVRRIVCGSRWIMVEGPTGVGLAPLPRHPRDLLPRLPQFGRRSLRQLARLGASWDPLHTALGLAAINAHYNRRDLAGRSGNGVKAMRRLPGRKVVIGAFPGVDEILPGCQVIEADPKPGEFPTVAMESLLPGCGGAVVNASALVNRSLPRILRLTQGQPLAVIGAATPLTPRLHAYGPSLLGGLVVDDPDGLAVAIKAGANAREFSQFGRYLHCGGTLDE